MKKKKLSLLVTSILIVTNVNAQDFTGDWKGSLAIQENHMELIFHIKKEDGKLVSTLDVPIQNAMGVPINETTTDGDELTLNISAIGAVYKGSIKNDSIVGTFSQAGMDFPLTLKRFENKLPGNTELVTPDEEFKKLAALDKGDYKYKVSDYFARPKASSFQLSPNGKYLSYFEKDDKNKNHVYVKDISTEKVLKAIEEKDEPIKEFGWINNERLYFSMDNGGNENYHIYATNIDGSNTRDLTPFKDVQANILTIWKENKDYIIIQMNKNNKQIFEPYKLNVITGDITQLFENKDVKNPIQGYDFDKDGHLRAYTKMVNGVETELWYKDLATDKFNLLKRNNWDDSFAILKFNYASKNPDDAYVMTNLNSDKIEIVLYDLKENKEIKKIFSNSNYDVAGMGTSRKRNWEIDYYSYVGEKYRVIPVSKTYKALLTELKEKFPNNEIYILDQDDNEVNYLFATASDKNSGVYYHYNSNTKEIKLLYNLMPQLKEEDMAEVRPITYKSRDGLTIHAYITLPKACLNGQKVPLIVNPHGGPQGIRDNWGFNPETQLFASRGYATLQVNFRISGGYGKAFLRTGFKQIGRKSIDDIEDGVKYVISQGWIDKDRIAIYGGSHGGYATLMGLVKTPDLYKCGVDYCGVSNIETFFSSFPEYWKPYIEMVKEIWYDLDDPKEAQIAKEVSPFYQIDKITKPIMVVQGANDPRVNINESDQIVVALRNKGFVVPYMVKYNEGHGYFREENRMEFYSAMMGFFAKYLK